VSLLNTPVKDASVYKGLPTASYLIQQRLLWFQQGEWYEHVASSKLNHNFDVFRDENERNEANARCSKTSLFFIQCVGKLFISLSCIWMSHLSDVILIDAFY
jgi:hypothetical protein